MSEHLAAPTWRTRQELLNIVDRLIAEFPDRPAGAVIAQVVRAREGQRLARFRSSPDALKLVERAARERILSSMPG